MNLKWSNVVGWTRNAFLFLSNVFLFSIVHCSSSSSCSWIIWYFKLNIGILFDFVYLKLFFFFKSLNKYFDICKIQYLSNSSHFERFRRKLIANTFTVRFPLILKNFISCLHLYFIWNQIQSFGTWPNKAWKITCEICKKKKKEQINSSIRVK